MHFINALSIMAVLILVSVQAAPVSPNAEPKCQCWEDFYTLQEAKGQAMCFYGMTFKVCNLPKPPVCQCSGGSFRLANRAALCTTNGGALHPCENSKDWDDYDTLCDEITAARG